MSSLEGLEGAKTEPRAHDLVGKNIISVTRRHAFGYVLAAICEMV